MKLQTNKKHNLSSHKIATLTYLLITELNDIQANSFLAKEIINKIDELIDEINHR